MKKIFLTSGLVLCMACPAFATAPAEIASDAASAMCESNVLTTSNAGDTVNFTALWTANRYKVTYDKGDHAATGVNDYDDEYNETTCPSCGAVYNENYTAKDASTTGVSAATGYTFVGYTTDSEPSVTRTTATNGTVANRWTDKSPWLFTSDQTVYAAYIAHQYTVSYDCGDGDGTIADETATYDSAYTANSGSSCSYTGRTFNGWSCKNSNNETVSLPASGANWTIDSDVSCTAQWGANVINLTWEVDGATYSTGTPSANCTYGTAIGTLPTAPTKTGYTFAGWDVSSVTPASNGGNSGGLENGDGNQQAIGG